MSCKTSISSTCAANISCAIDLLCDLENQIRCHVNDGLLTPDQAETSERFFRQLLTANSCLVMKKDNGDLVTNIAEVKNASTKLSTYGCRTYNKQLCKFVDHDFWNIELQATCRPSGTLFPFFLNYLTVSNPPGPDNKGPIYISTSPGFSTDISNPPSGSYIVVDRDELLVGLCQLKNHLLEKSKVFPLFSTNN